MAEKYFVEVMVYVTYTYKIYKINIFLGVVESKII